MCQDPSNASMEKLGCSARAMEARNFSFRCFVFFIHNYLFVDLFFFYFNVTVIFLFSCFSLNVASVNFPFYVVDLLVLIHGEKNEKNSSHVLESAYVSFPLVYSLWRFLIAAHEFNGF